MLYYGTQPIGFVSMGGTPLRVVMTSGYVLYPQGITGTAWGKLENNGTVDSTHRWTYNHYNAASYSAKYVPYLESQPTNGFYTVDGNQFLSETHVSAVAGTYTKWYKTTETKNVKAYVTITVLNTFLGSAISLTPTWAVFSTSTYSQNLCPVARQGSTTLSCPADSYSTHRFIFDLGSIPTNYRFNPLAFPGSAYLNITSICVHLTAT